jgi:hypothetical protein
MLSSKTSPESENGDKIPPTFNCQAKNLTAQLQPSMILQYGVIIQENF